MSKQLSTAGRQYVQAIAVLKTAEQAVAVAKELLIQASAECGETVVEADGKVVSLVEAVRRNFDVATLEGLVNAKVFGEVTKTVVEPKEFDKAREAGSISATIEEACVRPTPYVRIDVREAVAVSTSVAV